MTPPERQASRLEVLSDELHFLIKLKTSIGKLNNRIHDKLAEVAIEKLSRVPPKLSFKYRGAGAAGIDIQGFAGNDTLKLVAEVKTTHTSDKVKLRGPQKSQIRKDLRRLCNEPGELDRYLIVISEQTKRAVEDQLKTGTDFPTVRVLNALGNVDLDHVDDSD